MPEITGIVPFDRGYHVCTLEQLPEWLHSELYECECDGEHAYHDYKHVFGRARLTRRLSAWNERTARLYACDCAEHVLPLYEAAMPGDTRPRRAIEVARLYADGKATSEELAAAVDDARAAARAASWAAARAAAGTAAGAAAVDAAGAAAVDAAWAAARAAAWTAAGAAAVDAAVAAERKWQADRLRVVLYGVAQ